MEVSNLFSAKTRHRQLERMAAGKLDLLVIGGGITGAGIALDAQSRGLQTGLIEMKDFAAGTSSRSTKLIHGGLRYLKQFELKLVAEVGRERAIVYRNAPHVTEPIWMLLPIYEQGTFGKLSTSIGLKVYDFLAGVTRSERRRMLSRQAALQHEPQLRNLGLKAAGYYVEYRTDDARLTLENVKEAVQRGAIAAHYAKAFKFIYQGDRIVGVEVQDQHSERSYSIYAAHIVNAAGPWVDGLRALDGSRSGKHLHLTKGIHLVFDGAILPLRQAVYFDTPYEDGRMIFAIPRGGKTYVGTTDTNYSGDPSQVRIEPEDRDYIVGALRSMFPDLSIRASDIESGWAGLRPLIHEEGKDPSEISRKDEIFESPSGLITIAGGKLTGYRKMAERTVDLVVKRIQAKRPARIAACSTADIVLSGGQVGGPQHYGEFVQEKIEAGIRLGLNREAAERLVRLYGSNIDKVHRCIRAEPEAAQAAGLPLDVFASLKYSMEQESASTPSDYFVRRTGAVWFNTEWVLQWKKAVTAWMRSRLNWTETQSKQYEQELDQYLSEINQLKE